MPAHDIFHDNVKNALINDRWKITHDPLKIDFGNRDLFIDLGAEKLIAAEKENLKIAVEVKSFVGKSDIDDLEKALGQYILYHDVLAIKEPDRSLYLAVRNSVYLNTFQEPIGQLLIKNHRIKLLIFDAQKEVITQWIE
jgi:hypothetical protein